MIEMETFTVVGAVIETENVMKAGRAKVKKPAQRKV